MLFNFLKARQVLDLNISFETPGDQRSATVIYSSSTRRSNDFFPGENNNWNLLIIKQNGKTRQNKGI